MPNDDIFEVDTTLEHATVRVSTRIDPVRAQFLFDPDTSIRLFGMLVGTAALAFVVAGPLFALFLLALAFLVLLLGNLGPLETKTRVLEFRVSGVGVQLALHPVQVEVHADQLLVDGHEHPFSRRLTSAEFDQLGALLRPRDVGSRDDVPTEIQFRHVV